MSTGCYVKPITRKLFRAVLESQGIPPMREFVSMMQKALHTERGAMLRPAQYPFCDIYVNRVGGFLRKMGVDPVRGREAFVETLFKKMYADPKLYARCFVHDDDAQDFFATVLLHSGPPPPGDWEHRSQREQHAVDVKVFLQSLRSASSTLPMEQFVRVCDFKYEQFVLWCLNGGKFDDVDSDAETEVEN